MLQVVIGNMPEKGPVPSALLFACRPCARSITSRRPSTSGPCFPPGRSPPHVMSGQKQHEKCLGAVARGGGRGTDSAAPSFITRAPPELGGQAGVCSSRQPWRLGAFLPTATAFCSLVRARKMRAGEPFKLCSGLAFDVPYTRLGSAGRQWALRRRDRTVFAMSLQLPVCHPRRCPGFSTATTA